MIENKDIPALRREYLLKELSKKTADKNPFKQFTLWMNEAIEANISDANAMALATAGKDGTPSVRTVLLKGIDEKGFVFYTNYESNKAKDLTDNPKASLLFYWKELERQVRITGSAERTTRNESEVYFQSRPLESRLGAWASKQSSIIPDRKYLDEKFLQYEAQFREKEIPLPPFWGGFRIIPEKFEFWQGRLNRLHDRILYLNNNGNWEISRLSP